MKTTIHKKKLSTVTNPLSRKSKERLKEALPHGALKDIAAKLGVHYNTALRFDHMEVIQEALKMIKARKSTQKKEMRKMKNMLTELGS